MIIDDLKAAVPGFKWRVEGNRYVGTPGGADPLDVPIALHVRRDGRVARLGGFMYQYSIDVALYEGCAGDVVALVEAEAATADDESKRWEVTADDLRRVIKGGKS